MTPRLPAPGLLPSAAAVNRQLAGRRADAPVLAGRTLQLQIGRITLHGLPRAEGQRVAAAFVHELQRLAAILPWPTQAQDRAQARLPALQRAAGERPETTGRRLAQRIAAQWAPR